MAQQNGIYKCGVCGNIAQIVIAGKAKMVCCTKEMELLTENTVDAALEKHVPVIEKVDGGYKVVVGSVEHPMADDHYIQWVELEAGNSIYRTRLNPGEKPEALFKTDATSVTAREYCNLHGLWKVDL